MTSPIVPQVFFYSPSSFVTHHESGNVEIWMLRLIASLDAFYSHFSHSLSLSVFCVSTTRCLSKGFVHDILLYQFPHTYSSFAGFPHTHTFSCLPLTDCRLLPFSVGSTISIYAFHRHNHCFL